MGKRSDFERKPRDFYPTPAKAVVPLIPFLRGAGIRTFAEPCCGEGDLARHLESFGLRCAYQGDIRTGQDALTVDHYDADAIVTNPPYTRDVMHRLIVHFGRILPTWLLLESDWVSTLQAAPYLPHCSDIVPIGRVKWFSESKYSSKDNFAWFRFDARHKGATAIHRRGDSPLMQAGSGICQQCKKPYMPQRSTSRFCSSACKQLAYRKRRLTVTATVTGETFRYVPHDDVERFIADGWQATPALRGTHHGHYAVLMRRIEQG